jgi:YHS domain-containing protein
MDTSKLVRRVMLAAAVSAGTMSLTMTTSAGETGVARAARPSVLRRAAVTGNARTVSATPQNVAADSSIVVVNKPKRPVNQIQQTQYQSQPSGQGTPQNSGVSAELSRLFKENGQPMPSMNPADLPYASTPQMQLVRPTQPKKRNIFQKFIGRLRGKSSQPEQPQPAPPAPPGYSPYANQAAAHPVRATQAPTRRLRKVPTAQGAAGPGVTPANSNTRTAQLPRTPVAPAAQPTSIPVSRSSTSGAPTAFRQPGTAPAFLPQDSRAGNAAATRRSETVADDNARSTSIQAPNSSQPQQDDDFVNPFAQPANDANSDVLLDLDSLVSEPEDDGFGDFVSESPSAEDTATSLPPVVEKEVAPLDETPADDSPFTGVRLQMTDEEFFDSADDVKVEALEAEPVAAADEPTADESAHDLPSMSLPPIEEESAALLPAPREQEPLAAQEPANADTELATVRSREVNGEHVQQMADRQRREHQRVLILSRAGQSGFKGFCPVELRDNRELVDTDSSFTSTFGLQKYQFSSQQAKAAFELDPSRYAPAAGGSDVVLLVNAGEEQPGSLDFAVWYRDRIYMFRSRETLSLFVSNPQRFSSQY